MNRRQLFAMTLLPVAASAIGIPVFARVPHIALIATDGSVVARSDELPPDVCDWLQKVDRVGEFCANLTYHADRDVEIAYVELRDIETDPRINHRRATGSTKLLRGDTLKFTWKWNGHIESRSGGTLQ